MSVTAGLSASIRAIDASTSSTGEISLVPMRRRISTDESVSNSSDSDMISILARLGSAHERHRSASSLQPLHQALQQPGARFDRGEQHVFMIRVCAGAVDAQSIERWDAIATVKLPSDPPPT